jgi:hypothetical protein
MSCSHDDGPEEEPYIPSEYYYVLNSGNDGSNNASLTLYDVKEGTAVQEFFYAQNNRKLGDTGQDIIAYGNKIYIAVYGESTIEVTDPEAKSIKQIKTEGQPRHFTTHGGKVYVTYYNGYVAKIDTTSLTVEAKTQVGRNPDELVVANGKLYVANSGGLDFATETGYDKTVSVIDLATFTETKKIEVIINPEKMETDHNGGVYVISNGNYNMGTPPIPNTLQRIDTHTDEVTVIDQATMMTLSNGILYYIYSPWGASEINYYTYHTATQSRQSDHFIGQTTIASPFQINYDDTCEQLFITTSDYTNDGDVYVFDQANNFKTKFEAGLNPMKVIYVKR